MQIPPIPQLSHIVRHFLIMESAGADRMVHRLIPDGNPGIVFHYGTPFDPFPSSFVYGQVTRPHSIISHGHIGVFVVVLRPEALGLLTGLSAHALTDEAIALREIWGSGADGLEEQLFKAASTQQRLDIIQRFLLHHKMALPNSVVSFGIQWMEDREMPRIEDLAGELSVGRRTLERLFQTHIGISPKQFAGILRTRDFLKALCGQENRVLNGMENITSLAYEFGYYDQSHLIRDFKMKTGITPGKYFAARGALAPEFHSVWGVRLGSGGFDG